MLKRIKGFFPFMILPAILLKMPSASCQAPAKDSLLKEVVVTGQYAPGSLRKSVFQVRTISGDDIRLHGATDILGAMNSMTGIRFSTDATLGETDIQLMGISGQEIKVLLDGIPLVDRGATKQSLSQVDINSIDRIEVVEGPMSVVYGSDALAGVINIITKKPLRPGGHSQQLSVNARVQEESMGREYAAGSGKGLHHEHLDAGWQDQHWMLGGSFTRNNSGGWQGDTTGRAKEWMPKDQLFLGGTLGYHVGGLRASYRLDYLDETLKSTGNYFPPNYSATDAWYITNRYTHLLQLDWKAKDKWSLNSSVSYQDYQRRTQTTDINLQTGRRTLNLNSGSQDTSTFLSWFARTTAQYQASERLAFQAGIEFKEDRSTGQRISGHPEITDYSVFVSMQYKPSSRLEIRPGLRFSKNSIYDAPPVVPAINAKLTLGNDMDLRASYARGFRAPALRELYFNFHDANHDINGNPDLKAETSNSLRLSLARETGTAKGWAIRSSVAGFYNDYHNFINLALAGNNQYYYVNIDRNKTTGGTFETRLVHKSLEGAIGFSYIGIYNKYAGDSSYKDARMASFAWSPELSANISWRWKKAGLNAGLFYKYTGSQPSYQLVTVNQKEMVQLSRTGAFNMADLSLSKSLGRMLSLQGGVKNLFDVTRISNSSQDQSVAHSTGGPVLKSYGRSWFLGLNISFTSINKKQ